MRQRHCTHWGEPGNEASVTWGVELELGGPGLQTNTVQSLVPRPSIPPAIDRLQSKSECLGMRLVSISGILNIESGVFLSQMVED